MDVLVFSCVSVGHSLALNTDVGSYDPLGLFNGASKAKEITSMTEFPLIVKYSHSRSYLRTPIQ